MGCMEEHSAGGRSPTLPHPLPSIGLPGDRGLLRVTLALSVAFPLLLGALCPGDGGRGVR
jgi:hypothetical protein